MAYDRPSRHHIVPYATIGLVMYVTMEASRLFFYEDIIVVAYATRILVLKREGQPTSLTMERATKNLILLFVRCPPMYIRCPASRAQFPVGTMSASGIEFGM